MEFPSLGAYALAVLLFGFILLLDFRRRSLNASSFRRLPLLARLDLLPTAGTAALLVVLAGTLSARTLASGLIPLRSPGFFGALLCLCLAPVFWAEGKKQLQFQRPAGLPFAEWLFFLGVAGLLIALIAVPPGASGRTPSAWLSLLVLLVAGIMVARIVPPFMRRYEGLRILETVGHDEQVAQPEYTPATPECPHPELWRMLDSQTTEVEVLDFLKTLVTTVKPKLIVETGTFLGHGTLKLAEGARENGFGRVITVEFDPDIRERALQRFTDSGLSSWIESRLESSLETVIAGTIDLLYSDSHLANREAEIRRLLPQLSPAGLLVIHDASSHFRIVREAALRLEAEGLISTVLLPTPRGVVIAQRREGRV